MDGIWPFVANGWKERERTDPETMRRREYA